MKHYHNTIYVQMCGVYVSEMWMSITGGRGARIEPREEQRKSAIAMRMRDVYTHVQIAKYHRGLTELEFGTGRINGELR